MTQEANDLADASRVYDAVFDRDLSVAEQQTQLMYNSLDDLATALTGQSEFTQKYGSLTNAEYVERIYQNADGRSANLSELSSAVAEINAGTVSRAAFAVTVAQSAEHRADGDVHAVTNNTDVVNGAFSLDHTTDKEVAAETVDRLTVTALDRHATAAEAGDGAAGILNGTQTETGLANALISSQEFASDYGALDSEQFVSRVYENGLGHDATAAELSTWGSMLDAGTLSRADLLVAVADSPDHLAVENASPAAAAASASMNQMIQAMAVSTPQSSASTPPMVAQQAAQQHQLAAAPH